MLNKARLTPAKAKEMNGPRQINTHTHIYIYVYRVSNLPFEATVAKDPCKLMYSKPMLNADNCADR